MSLFLLFTTVFTGAFALPSNNIPLWAPAGFGDARSPCPLLNTLANHNIIPHNGKNITLPILQTGFKKYVNIGTDVATALGTAAIELLSAPDSDSFDLDELDKHNVIEHDGSLSRADAFFGNDYSFNPSIYMHTKSYFTEPTIDIPTGAKARLARMTTAKAINPTFNLTAAGTQASFTETPFYLSLFGDPVTGVATTQWVNIFFEEERLPYLEGWTPRTAEMNLTTLGAMAQKLIAATPANALPPGFDSFGKGFFGIH